MISNVYDGQLALGGALNKKKTGWEILFNMGDEMMEMFGQVLTYGTLSGLVRKNEECKFQLDTLHKIILNGADREVM